MITIHSATTSDLVTIRLVKRDADPLHVLVIDDGRIAGFTSLCNNRDQAVRAFVRTVEQANATAPIQTGATNVFVPQS